VRRNEEKNQTANNRCHTGTSSRCRDSSDDRKMIEQDRIIWFISWTGYTRLCVALPAAIAYIEHALADLHGAS